MKNRTFFFHFYQSPEDADKNWEEHNWGTSYVERSHLYFNSKESTPKGRGFEFTPKRG